MMWMNLENIILGETNQAQKIPFLKREIFIHKKSPE